MLLPNEIDVPYDWEQVISSSSSEEEYHFHKGCECNEKREYEQAVFNLDKAIRTNTLRPNLMVRAYYERGYSRYKKGNLKDAWQDYLKSLQTEPDSHFHDLRFNWYKQRQWAGKHQRVYRIDRGLSRQRGALLFAGIGSA